MPTKVWVVAGPEWKATALALREIDNRLPSWMREEMREDIDPLVKKAQAAVQSINVLGGPAGHTGLRKRVAAGVGYRAGVGRNPYFRVYTSMADPSESPIPRGLDQWRGWRHPLFGDKRYWFTSTPDRTGWFTDTIASGQDEIERALESALERAARRVDRAS